MASTNRRDALKTGAALAATAAASSFFPAYAAATDTLKVGVIGCGGRGTGAIEDNFNAGPGTVLWAVGDVFENKTKGLINHITKYKEGIHKERVECKDRIFAGLDAAKSVIDSGCDLIILATSPGFRPFHLEAIVQKAADTKKKIHIFCEKPVAVDGAGIQKVLKVAEEAKKLGISIVAGTQRRHQTEYLMAMDKIHGGEIGQIVSTRCSWNGGEPWFRPRLKGQSDVEYQIHNWYHFLWLCGDHIVEQHVHNIDVINWAMKGHPVKAVGQGGRIGRKDGEPEVAGNIYDLFCIEYEYDGGVPMYSYCSHVPRTTSDVSEMVIGTKGVAKLDDIKDGCKINGTSVFSRPDKYIRPYVQEHVDLMKTIRDGKPVDELTGVAESTLTAIMGRMAVYSGKVVKWEDALKSKSTMPENLDLKGELKVAPVPMQGDKL
jgi:myo-inositol 2-dehydrogenase / D-chiro-inositol 1-dehydrogenase